MKKILFFGLALGGIILAGQFQSCQREPVYIGDLLVDPNNPNDTIPNDTIQQNLHPCDPDSVYFEKDVLPILISNCAMSGCHDQASHKEGVILTTYDYVKSTGGIKVNSPASSKIYQVLSGGGEEAMPPSPRSPLTSAQKATLLKWIQQGAKNLTCDDCSTDNVTFAGTIQPLLNNRCVGCHGNVDPGGGIKLQNYNQILTQVSNGKLWGAVNREAGFKYMPPSGPKLPDCNLEQIQIWINDGAPNN